MATFKDFLNKKAFLKKTLFTKMFFFQIRTVKWITYLFDRFKIVIYNTTLILLKQIKVLYLIWFCAAWHGP